MECIDRKAFLTHLRECKETSTGSGLTAAVITAILSFVEEMPLADTAPVVHGHWRWDFSLNGDNFYRCSVCGEQEILSEKQDVYDRFPYCHCGARMDEKGETHQETKTEDCGESPHEKRSKMSWGQIWESKVGSAEVLEKSMSKKGRDYGEYFNVNQEASGN